VKTAIPRHKRQVAETNGNEKILKSSQRKRMMPYITDKSIQIASDFLSETMHATRQ
jgi:hypothetical protein